MGALGWDGLCVCVCERERERERHGWVDVTRYNLINIMKNGWKYQEYGFFYNWQNRILGTNPKNLG